MMLHCALTLVNLLVNSLNRPAKPRSLVSVEFMMSVTDGVFHKTELCIINSSCLLRLVLDRFFEARYTPPQLPPLFRCLAGKRLLFQLLHFNLCGHHQPRVVGVHLSIPVHLLHAQCLLIRDFGVRIFLTCLALIHYGVLLRVEIISYG